MTMKKLLSILSAGLLALVAFSCVKEEFATFDDSKATAPVIGSYEMGEKALTISFTPGAFNTGFNDKMPVNHSIILASVNGKTVNIPSYQVKAGEYGYEIQFPYVFVSSVDEYKDYEKYFVDTPPYNEDELKNLAALSFDELQKAATELSIEDVKKRHAN